MSARSGSGLFWPYVILAIIGAIIPYWLLLPWALEHRFAPGLFVSQLFATAPAAIFSTDAILSSIVFLIFVFAEGRRLRMQRLWLPPLIVVVVGLCCALPFFSRAARTAAAFVGSRLGLSRPDGR